MSEETFTSCKVVLLGESGVGKTCIINRFMNDTFEEGNISTTGASYADKVMNFPEYDKSIKFEIWDTAGQEKYRALTKIFYKDAAIAILVYDITNKKSFDEMRDYWYQQVFNTSPKNIIYAVAANKSDLFDNEQVNETEAREFAKEIGAIFKLTSSFNGSGIDELFQTIGKKKLNPSFEEETPTTKNDNKIVLGKGEKNKSKKDKKCC